MVVGQFLASAFAICSCKGSWDEKSVDDWIRGEGECRRREAEGEVGNIGEGGCVCKARSHTSVESRLNVHFFNFKVLLTETNVKEKQKRSCHLKFYSNNYQTLKVYCVDSDMILKDYYTVVFQDLYKLPEDKKIVIIINVMIISISF